MTIKYTFVSYITFSKTGTIMSYSTLPKFPHSNFFITKIKISDEQQRFMKYAHIQKYVKL